MVCITVMEVTHTYIRRAFAWHGCFRVRSDVFVVPQYYYQSPIGDRYIVHRDGIIDIVTGKVIVDSGYYRCSRQLSFDGTSICFKSTPFGGVISNEWVWIVRPRTGKVKALYQHKNNRMSGYMGNIRIALRRYPIPSKYGSYTRYGSIFTEHNGATFNGIRLPRKCYYSPEGYSRIIDTRHYECFNGKVMVLCADDFNVLYGETSHVRIITTRHYSA